MNRRKSVKIFSVLMVLMLAATMLLTGCGGEEAEGPTITVASKPWTEQLILGNMLIDLFEHHGFLLKTVWDLVSPT